MATADPGVSSWTPINVFAMLRALVNNGCPILTNSGPPVSGASGTYAGQAGPGTLLIDYLNGVLYINASTLASPLWGVVFGAAPSLLSVNGAINSHLSRTYVITKAGVYAGTLAAPTAGADDGAYIDITSDTANAHTITFPAGVLKNGGAAVTVFTFTGTTSGGGLSLYAYNGTWKVLSSAGGAFS